MKKRIVLILLIGLAGITALVVWPPPRDTESPPRNAEYYYNRGCERLPGDNDHPGDPLGALADFNRAIKLNPEFAAAYATRAAAKERIAEQAKSRAASIVQQSASQKQKAYLDEVMADLNRAIELNPKEESYYSRRANLKRDKGDFSGMLADIERAIEVCPPELNRLKGAFVVRPERILRGGLRNYDHAVALNPAFAWGFYHRGVLRHLANEFDGALADFRQCSEFHDRRLKDYAAIHSWLVRAQKGESAGANLELSTYLNSRANGTTNDWDVKIADFLLGRISEAELSAGVGATDVARERSQFWFYAGMKQLLAGNKSIAADYFRASRATATRPYAVEISARVILSALDR